MSSILPGNLTELSFAVQRRLDAICMAFERAWREGEPRLEAYLEGIPEPERGHLFRELLLLEQEMRQSRSLPSRQHVYSSLFPEYLTLIGSCSNEPRVGTVSLPDLSGAGYELLEIVGRGGMGVVYKARQVDLERVVAVKVLAGLDHARKEALTRFRLEGEMLARIRHPNIVQVYEVGIHNGISFLALEYVEGGNLGQRLGNNIWPTRAAAGLVRILAEAVQAAHAQGVIHRDLKPANVLLMSDGTPKVTDFGLAKRLDVEGPTHSGEMIGTPHYMAPEQFGTNQPLTPATDVYALGVVLYTLLTGQVPFPQRDLGALLDRIRRHEPPSLSGISRSVPRDLETITLKCLHKEPARRYPSAASLAEDLRRYLANEPISARRVSALEQVRLWGRRNPAIAILLSALLLVLSIGIVGIGTVAIEASNQASQARKEAQAARLARADAESAELLARRRESNANSLLTQLAWEQRTLGRFRELLAAQVPAEGKLDLRGFEWHYWQRQFHRTHQTWWGHGDVINAVGFSPDGSQLVSASYDQSVVLRHATTGDELQVFHGHLHHVTGGCFTPDGRRIVSSSLDRTVKIWQVDGSGPCVTLGPVSSPLYCVAISGEGERIAAGAEDGRIHIWQTATGKLLRTLEGHTHIVGSLSFDHTGLRLASCSKDGTVCIWPLDRETEPMTFRDHGAGVWGVALSPDGKWLASAGESPRQVIVQGARTGEVRFRFRSHKAGVLRVAFSPNGKRLASSDHDGAIKLYDMEKGVEMTTLLGHERDIYAIAFSPCGKRLASAGYEPRVFVWDLERCLAPAIVRQFDHQITGVALDPTSGRLAVVRSQGEFSAYSLLSGHEAYRCKGHIGPINAVAYDLEGRLLATAGDDRTVRVWDGRSGAPVRTLTGPTAPILSLAISREGHRIAAGDRTGVIRVWDAATGEPRLQLNGHTKGVTGLAFGRGGLLASSSLDRTVRVWNTSAEKPTVVLTGHDEKAWCVVFDDTGDRLASGSEDRTVRIWDVSRGQVLLVCRGHTATVYSVAFQPGGTRLASGCDDGGVKVWDTTTGLEVLTIPGHTGRVSCVQFTPDGEQLVTGGKDHRLRIWDARPLTPGKVFDAHDGLRRALAFLHSGDYAGYRAVCRSMLDSIASSRARGDLRAASQVAWICAMGPDGIDDLGDPTRLVRQGLARLASARPYLRPERIKNEERMQRSLRSTLGALLFRSGRTQEAIEVLEGNVRLREEEGIYDWLFLAMAYHRLGRLEEARNWFARAEKHHAGTDAPGELPELMTRFYREAKAILGVD